MIQERGSVKCRLCTGDSVHDNLLIHFKNDHKVESEDFEVINCLLLLHFSKDIGDAISKTTIGYRKRRKSVSEGALAFNAKTFYNNEKNGNENLLPKNQITAKAPIDEKKNTPLKKSLTKTLKVVTIFQAEATIDDFNLKDSTTPKPAEIIVEIPPLSKTRSGRTDPNEESNKIVATPNNKKTWIDFIDSPFNYNSKATPKSKPITPQKKTLDLAQIDNADLTTKNVKKTPPKLNAKSPKSSIVLQQSANTIPFSPSKLNIQIDDDISFSIESPTLDCNTNKETPKRILKELQLGNVEEVRNNLEGSFDDDTKSDIEMKKNSPTNLVGENDPITQVKMKRHMIAAVQGRFICPSENCDFKCESKVILNIHVRKRHVDKFGSPIRKEKMIIRLNKNEIPAELLETIGPSERKIVHVRGFRAEGPLATLKQSELHFNNQENANNENLQSKSLKNKELAPISVSNDSNKTEKIMSNQPQKETIVTELDMSTKGKTVANIDLPSSSKLPTPNQSNAQNKVVKSSALKHFNTAATPLPAFSPKSTTPGQQNTENKPMNDLKHSATPISAPTKKNELPKPLVTRSCSPNKSQTISKPVATVEKPFSPTTPTEHNVKDGKITNYFTNTPRNVTPSITPSLESRGVKRKAFCDSDQKLRKSDHGENASTPCVTMPSKKLCLDSTGKAKSKVGNKENEAQKEKAVEKMRLLQKGKSHGTYVQCSKSSCEKWRFLPEYEDPAQIPENWECSMNANKSVNACSKGKSERFVEESDEFIDTEYACGSMVWAKLKGYPWWPGMVDYCPDTDEYYWMDDWDKAKDSTEEHIKLTTSQPSWYHVMFFDVPHVNRSWIRVEDLVKMEDAKKPPKDVRNPKLKTRWNKATNMAVQCLSLDREKRIEKYSFAALYDGKWGHYSDDEEAEKSKSNKTKKSHSEEKLLKTLNKSMSRVNSPDSSKLPTKVKSKHDWKPSQLLNLWKSPTTTHSKEFPDDWACKICTKLMPHVENLVVEHLKFHHMTPEDYLAKYEKSDQSGTLIYMVNWKQEKTIADYLRDDDNGSENSRKEIVEREYKKPSLDAESLIALAVKNIDPKNETGATFDEIISFITIIFPYFNKNPWECKSMVLKVYNCTSEDMTKGRFRLKPALLDKLLDRVQKALSSNTKAIEDALIFPELIGRLNAKISDFDKEKHPGYSDFMLALFAMIALKVPATTNQIAIFLTMLFPYVYKEIGSWKKKFSGQIHKEKEFVEVEEDGVKKYKVNEIMWMRSSKILEDFTRMPHNMEVLKQSVFDERFLSVLFPSFSWN